MNKQFAFPLAGGLLLLAFCSATVRAQAPAKSELTPEQERALALVSDQLEVIKALEPKWQRVDLLTQAATLFWKHRQAKAREVFQAAYDLAEESVRDKEDTALKSGGTRVVVRGDMRLEVIRAIAKHDAKWGQQLTADLLAPPKDKEQAGKTQNAAAANNLYNGILWQAQQLLEVDQAFAVQMARSSLAGAGGHSIANFLVALAKLNRPAADDFYREALTFMAKRSIQELLALYTYPFASERTVGAEWRSSFLVGATQLQPSPPLQLLFLQTLLQVAARYSDPQADQAAPRDGAYNLTPAAKLFLAFKDLAPIVAVQFPQLHASLLEAQQAVAAVMTGEQVQTTQGIYAAKQPQPGNAFEQRLEQAEKEKDPGRKDRFYFDALMAGVKGEKPEALESVLRKISDLTMRGQVNDWLYYTLAQRAISDGQFDEASKFAEAVVLLDLRAFLGFQLAEAALTKLNDRQRATEFLDAAQRLADKADNSNEKAKALLGLAELYRRIDRQTALSVLRAAIKTLNQIKEPDVQSGKLLKSVKGQDFQAFMQYEVPGFTLNNAFQAFGRADFEDALAVARELDDKVLRASAVLALSSFCLEKLPAQPAPAKQPAAKPEAKQAGKPK